MLLIQLLLCSACMQRAAAFATDIHIWSEDTSWKRSNATFRSFSVFQMLQCHENKCQHMEWLKHNNFDQCVTVVSDFTISSCVYSQFVRNNMTYKLKSKSHLIGRDLKHQRVQSTACSAYMIFTRDVSFLHRLFNVKQRHFRPFTQIFMVHPHSVHLNKQNVLNAMGHAYKIYSLYSNFYNHSTQYIDLSYLSLFNHYTNATMDTSTENRTEIREFFGTPSQHALFDRNIMASQKKKFRIGVFHCPPYIMILNNDTKELTGLEYMFIKDVTQGWNIEFIIFNGRTNMMDHLTSRYIDMSTCSLWLNYNNHRKYDLVSYFDRQCVTLMVPKQRFLYGSNIYLSLRNNIWLSVAVSFVGIALTLIVISRLSVRWRIYRPKQAPYRHIGIAIMEIVNVATSHGMNHISLQTSIRFALSGWIIFSLYFSTIYSTGYMSILAAPPTSAPVNTVEDFVGRGLIWASYDDKRKVIEALLEYNQSVYKRLVDSRTIEKTPEKRLRHIHKNKYGYLVAQLSNYYIYDVPMGNTTDMFPLRLMNECMLNMFTVFGFQPNSPYARYFSDKLDIYHQSGTMWLWFEKLITNQFSFMKHSKKPPIERLINRPLHFSDTCGAFYLLAAGWVMAFIAFLFELHSHRRAKKRAALIELRELPEFQAKRMQRFKISLFHKKRLQRSDVQVSE